MVRLHQRGAEVGRTVVNETVRDVGKLADAVGLSAASARLGKRPPHHRGRLSARTAKPGQRRWIRSLVLRGSQVRILLPPLAFFCCRTRRQQPVEGNGCPGVKKAPGAHQATS